MECPIISRWEVAADAAGVLAGQLAQVHADLVELMVQVLATDAWSGDGVRSPEHWLMIHCALSKSRAADVVAIARRREDFPELAARMSQGSVSVDQFAVVARHVPAEYGASVVDFVEYATVSQLRRVLPKYPYEAPADPLADVSPHGALPVDDAPRVSMGSDGARFWLRFESDALDGAVVEQAVREAKDALFTAGDVHATLADGLVEVARRSLDAAGSVSRRRHYQVMVHLEADGRGWIHKRGALPQHVLRKLTCDGVVRPVWLENGSPVSVGRSQRIVPHRSRVLIEDRDGGCRYPGCEVVGFVENHHLVHWADGGATDLDGLVSLCPRHHREHHQGRFEITGTPAGPDGLVFVGRGGDPIAVRIPERVPVVDHPPPVPPPMKGWPLTAEFQLALRRDAPLENTA